MLYTNENRDSAVHLPLGLFPMMEENDVQGVFCSVTFEEVQGSIMTTGSHKSLDPNNFYAFFYLSQWANIGHIIYNFVIDIFSGKELVASVNDTFIGLLLKAHKP